MKTIIKSTLLFFMLAKLTFGYGFTYSGPSYVTTNFESSTASATFTFSYYDTDGIVWPRLAIVVDGTLVSGSVNDRTTPYSYTATGLTPGEHTFEFTLFSLDDDPVERNEINHQGESTTVNVRITVKVQNNFIGGNIYVGNTTTSVTSPYYKTASENSNFIVGAIDQQYNGTDYIWNTNGTNNSEWKDDKGTGFTQFASSRNATYTVDDWNTNTVVQAYLRKICNLTFETNLGDIGVTEPCSIKVNGATVVTPTAQYPVVDQSTILVEAIDKTILDVHLKFWYWSGVPYIGRTNNPITITADATETIIAVYAKAPDTIAPSAPQNVTITESANEHPIISWDENPELDMRRYKIYRKRNGGSWDLIWTISDTTLEDEAVTTTYRHGDDFYYKVKAEDIFYNLSDYSNTVGVEARYLKQNHEEEVAEEMPKEYALNSNYPNPFNPTTQISYQIPKDGFVSLTVYNSLGQKVSQLVNQHQSIGNYSVQFNAVNLPSGVYIYKLHVSLGSITNFSSTKKMLLLK